MKTNTHPDRFTHRSRPSLRRGFCAGLLAVFCMLSVQWGSAADSSPPVGISYQGYLTGSDTDQTPLGNSEPTNYEIQFRIFAAEEGGSAIWAEKQTVTVDKGVFSVMLGEGDEISGETALHVDIDTIFDDEDASDRYVEITVIESGQSAGTAIAPRLRLVTSPYAFLATKAIMADSIRGDVLSYDTTSTEITISKDSKFEKSLDVTGAVTMDTTLGVDDKLTSGAVQILDGVSASLTDYMLRIGNDSSAALHLDQNEVQAVTSTAEAGDLKLQILGGNVGIGKSPVVKLDVSGDAAFSGEVGIGTTTPTETLDVSGTFAVSGLATLKDDLVVKGTQNQNLNTAGILEVHEGTTKILRLDGDEIQSVDDSNEARKLHLNVDGGDIQLGDTSSEVIIYGELGVGTASPDFPLHITSFRDNYGFSREAIGHAAGFGDRSNEGATEDVSIFVDDVILAREFAVVSDRRLKNVVARLNGPGALEMINRLQVTDYRMRDFVRHGKRLQRGFIAQEVENVLPSAVDRREGVIPDVYQSAAEVRYRKDDRTLAIRLKQRHDLTVGDRVQFIVKGAAVMGVVSNVPAPDWFEVGDWREAVDDVFVIGREVEDLRSVDSNVIFTTGIAAIQEVNRKLEQSNARLQAEVNEVQAVNRDLSAQLASVMARLQSLESLVK